MSYVRHENLVEAARARPALWRLLIGLMLAASGQFLAVALIMGGFILVLSPEEAAPRIMGLMSPVTPEATLLVLFSFLGLVLGTWAAARLLQGRSFRSLFGHPATVLRHFVTAAVTISVLFGLAVLLWPLETRAGLPFQNWLILLPLSLLAVLIQTGAEEIAFRGYLQTQLAARFRRPVIWLMGPAILFGALHFAPQIQGDTAIIAVGAATLFGVIAGDLTARTGSIGAAWGFHFANNSLAILILATPGALSGLSLRLQLADITVLPDPITILGELFLLVFGWFALRRILQV